MTYIAKPNIDDNEVLNHIARDMLTTNQEGQTMLKRRVRVATENGVIHELSFSQMDGLLNILDTTREIPVVSPLQYIIQTYNLEDLVHLGKDGWIVPEYTVMVIATNPTPMVRFEGKLIRHGSMDKEFAFALGGFDFIQQLSLARCIAKVDERFEQVTGTFDVDYTFTTGPEGTKVFTGVGLK
jgi:hypothetical protein